jgi:integrase
VKANDRLLDAGQERTYARSDNAKAGAPLTRPPARTQEAESPMSDSTVLADLYKRHRTKEPLVTFRSRRDGSRSYYVQHSGTHVPAGSTLEEAKAKKAELGLAKHRGEKPVIQTRTTFGELAESWFEAKTPRLRPRTASYYRSALDLVLLPRFGSSRIGAVDADAVSKLIRDLERDGLHAIEPRRPKRPLGRSSVDNYLKPAQAIMARAVRRRLIGVSPFDLLTSDDRPKQDEKAPPHEWTEDELAALLAASEANGAKPESRYDYSPLLRLTAALGLRCGEVLGLRWEDFDRDAGYLHVRRQWLRSSEYGPTKTRAGVRSIALPADLKQLLLELRMQSKHSQESDPIFVSRSGKPLGHRNVTRRGWEAARDTAGIPKSLSFHDLRHAAASRMIDAGLDPVTVAAVLGHEDPHITLKTYAARFNRQRKDDAVRLALAGSVSS